MKTNEAMISVQELQHLVMELKESEPDIGFRFRLIGDMWQINYLKIVTAYGRAVSLADEVANKTIFINDLSQIIQFELDRPFQSFQPYFHYNVVVRTQLQLY